jgi:DNA-binding CsgD family transcriptional regulator
MSPVSRISRFSTYLTHNPSTENLLQSLKRDYLSACSIESIQIETLSHNESLATFLAVGAPIESGTIKNVSWLSELVSYPNIFGVLEVAGAIYDSQNRLTITAINLNSSIKGFYLFKHAQDFVSNEYVSNEIQAYSNLMTFYFSNKPNFMSLIENQSASGDGSIPPKFSSRQRLILVGMADGNTNHELALELGFSVSTIRHETMAIYQALGVSDRKEAALVARSLGVI